MSTVRLTPAQRRYLELADSHAFEQGWGGYSSTLTVRILEERGLLIVNHFGDRWRVAGLTAAGRAALGR